MRFRPSIIHAFLAALALANPVVAQERLADLLADPALDLSRPADRERVVGRMAKIENTRRVNARAKATARGLPLRTVLPNGRIQEIADFDAEQPLYLTTHNANAAISTGANLIRTSPYSLNGSGITIGLWDGGAALSSHQEFGGRVTVKDAGIIDHATHVCGTLIASGVDPLARGMAGAALVDSYDWTNDFSEMTGRGASTAGVTGRIYLSNHSYGYVSGWNYVNGGSPLRIWEWYGSGTTASSIETDFGVYNDKPLNHDSLAFSLPYYLIFRSAGNDRGDNPTSGQSVALSPGGAAVTYNPASHPAGDGNYRGGFDTIGFEALAKNVITVGSATDAVTGGVRNVSAAAVSYFSAWGPTDDGRIKPDVVANGDDLYSSISSGTNQYGTYRGTSMSTPNACGSAALLIQQYGQLFPTQAMRSSTLKGLLIHTADDRGNAGPDYKYGWGLVNVKTAADLIQDHFTFPIKKRLGENQLTTSTVTRTSSFVWDGVSPLRATLCWTDPAGTSYTTISDDRTPRLKNNLNLKIIAPNGSEYSPFVMPFVGDWTQASMDLPATTGINNTDNVEQVFIAAPPAAGTYQALVSFSGTLTNGSQYYSLLISGSSDQPPPPPLPPANLVATPGNNSVTLSWSPAADATGYNVKRSTISGGPYTLLGSTAATSYLDGTALNDTPYYYVVASTNALGEGANSGQIMAIPAPAPSSTALASSPSPSGAYGSTVTFTATVTGSGGTPTGTVTFRNGATTLGSGSLNASGIATFSISNLSLGSHSITAAYPGDLVFAASNSSPLAYAVTPKPVTITGVTAANKVYDGTTSASLSGGTVSGVLSGEIVTVVPGIGVFSDSNAGTQSVTATGYSIGGTHAGNYLLAAQPSVAAATITPLTIQLAGLRTYDGTTAISANDLSVQNNLDGTNLTLTGNANIAGKDVGTQAVSPRVVANRVQIKTGSTGNSFQLSSFTVTMDATPVSGNTMVAVISTRGSTSNRITSVIQTGAAWSRASQATNTNGTTTEIWYAAGVSNAAQAITINLASSLTSAAVVMEYSGVLSPNPLDQTQAATGNNTNPVTGTTPTTSQTDELWIGGIGIAGSNPALGTIQNSFTLVASAESTRNKAFNDAKVYALERILTPAGPASSGGTLTSSAQWAGTIATFKTASPQTLAISGPAAGNYTLAGAVGSVQIIPKTLIIGGISASDKAYDGTIGAGLTGSPALLDSEAAGTGTTADGKPYVGDAVSPLGTPSGTFTDRHAGITKPVTVIGLTVAGSQAANYSPLQPSGLTATINPREITVTAVTCTKVYDGTTIATGTPTLSQSLVSGDTATTLTQTFQDSDAGEGNKVIIPNISINDDNSGGNYAVTLENCLTGTITRAPAVVTLGNLSQVCDGFEKTVSVTTDPEGLAVTVTYDGSATAPISAGSYAVSATADGPNHHGSATGTLVIAPGNDWDAWSNDHFTESEVMAGLAAENADPDADGLMNLAEYALGTNPHQFSPPLVAIRDANGLSLTFTRPANLPDVTYAAESSEALDAWSPVPLEVLETGDPETVRARDPLVTGDPARRFLRLRFERQ